MAAVRERRRDRARAPVRIVGIVPEPDVSDAFEELARLGLDGAAYAAPIDGARGSDGGVGFAAHDLVTPASVMKVQVALAVEHAIATGRLDGARPCTVPAGPRTPGPTGLSLMQDAATLSVRDLVTAMVTISDNVATDVLLELVGLDEVNRITRALGLERTLVTASLRSMLDAIARDAGFGDFEALAAHDPTASGALSDDEVARRVERSAPLDPMRGTRTTAAEAVSLLQAIWTDRAGSAPACRRVRAVMSRQLSTSRIASGFDPSSQVAAKSGALLGVVRNEVGVVTSAGAATVAVAVFTRRPHASAAAPAEIDAAIGRVARRLVDEIRGG
jgi:beta-lactamase class A